MTVLGDGIIVKYVTKIIDLPPKIVVDIFYSANPSKSMTVPVKSPIVKRVRVGYHSEIIRLVLDIKGTTVPLFKTKTTDNILTILLKSKEVMDKKKTSALEKHDPENGETRRFDAKDSDLPSTPESGRNSPISPGPLRDGPRPPCETQGEAGEPEQSRSCMKIRNEVPAFQQLTNIAENDGKDDTALFLKCVGVYRDQNWERVIENCNHLIKQYPEGRYVERAYFLRAKSYEQLHSFSIGAHLIDIKHYYEDAVNRFPNSIYVPESLLAIGNVCFESKNYYEAIGYYNLVVKKDEGSIAALRALIQKAKILQLKERRKEALSILEYIVGRYPCLPEQTEAKIEMAKILYEMNNFRKSIDILSGFVNMHTETIHQYPEIFLYLGRNYYQLEDYQRARENLFRFYNSCPDREINHLILTKIADTYNNEGLIDDAVKIYQLVFELYPDKEGALISLIRLAEQQEKGVLQIKRGIEPSVKTIGKEIGLPKEIYEDIMNSHLIKDEKNPLAQLALLKLAMLYQEEKNYEKGLQILKELLTKYPKTSLKKECVHALEKTLLSILNEQMKRRRYTNIINMYHKERDLFLMINSPDQFLVVARALKNIKLHDMATEMFFRVDSLLPDDQKPADLLFYVGKELGQKKDELAGGLSRLDLLIEHYPTDENIPEAYHLKGKILFKQKKYTQAAEMFSSALRYDLRRCTKAGFLIDKARALMKCKLTKRALQATRNADELKKGCYMHHPQLYQDTGKLYLKLGHPKKALSIFNTALEMESENERRIGLQLMVARCYEVLDKKKDYLSLYNQISSINDPFWSNVAKEKIDAVNFAREMKEAKKK